MSFQEHKVDYAWSFGLPHRVTLCRPGAGQKTLVDLYADNIRISWTYHTLAEKELNVWDSPRTEWYTQLSFSADGRAFEGLTGSRFASGVPSFAVKGSSGAVSVSARGIASRLGDAVHITFTNRGETPADCRALCEHTNGWVISNPAWVDGRGANMLEAMQSERPDRLLVWACGAQDYPLERLPDDADASAVPLNESERKRNPAKTLTMRWTVPPRSSAEGWLIRPYRAYGEDPSSLVCEDWENACREAEREWEELLNRGARPIIPDAEMESCFYSCLADIFVMSEPLAGGYHGITPGTEVYRSTNSGEALIAAQLLDQLGYREEALQEFPVHLEAQGNDGDWSDPHGWTHHIPIAHRKCSVILEHAKLTGDMDFLAFWYPRMRASELYTHAQRQLTKKDPASPYYGMLPRCMGDAGMSEGNDYFGHFFPHECAALAADKMTAEAARMLGLADDAALFEGYYEEASRDVLSAMRRGCIRESGGTVWLSCTPNKTSGSMFGALDAYRLVRMIDRDDPLFVGTLHHMEAHKNAGGQPLGTGWMKDGIWAAMALDNLGQTYLEMNEGDRAAEYLYSTVNHATPFRTWCEERGAEAGSTKTSGDLQHLWTPLAVAQFVRNALAFDASDGMLHLAMATDRGWLRPGSAVGIDRAWVHGGKISYRLSREDGGTLRCKLSLGGKTASRPFRLHLRLPEEDASLRVETVSGGRAELQGSELLVTPSAGRMEIVVRVS